MAVRDIPDTAGSSTIPRPTPVRRRKLLFLVTEDWYFCSHRLPVARAAHAAGFEIIVATRVRAHGDRIRQEGFAVHSIAWRRRGDGLLGAYRAISEIAQVYRAEQPDLIHHIALKPVLFGGIARRLAFGASANAPVVVDAITGFGSAFSHTSLAGRLRRLWLGLYLRLMKGGERRWIIAQNEEDRAALAKAMADRARIVMIKGSGIDTTHFSPIPDPASAVVTVAVVSRMLRAKGVLDAIAATRLLRERGLPIELQLAGPTDPDNRGSLNAEFLTSLSNEPGIRWLGPVADVRTVWRCAAIALLPSTYGEGVPKALLEAAACSRPIIATDVPGCREVVHPGETGILVPPRDIPRLAAAIAELACDSGRRATMGRAGRALIERAFAENIVAQETLAIYEAALHEKAR